MMPAMSATIERPTFDVEPSKAGLSPSMPSEGLIDVDAPPSPDARWVRPALDRLCWSSPRSPTCGT